MEEILTLVIDFLKFINNNIVFLNIIIIIFIVFRQKREPITIFLWIFVLIFLPISGLIFYAFLGHQIRKEKKFQLKGMDETFVRYMQKSSPNKVLMQMLSNNDTSRFDELINYNYNITKNLYTVNNKVDLINDGKEKFAKLIKDIEKAKRYIFIQYYIIKDDEVFNSIKSKLIKKSKEGIKVCLIFDGMGSRLIKRRVWKELMKYDIEIISFYPPIFGPINIRMNYRNHRKIVVIDGRIAYIGGFNIGKEYIGKDARFGYWRDTHLRISGEAVADIEKQFIMDFNYANRDKNKLLKFRDKNNFYPEVQDKIGMQIISSGPDTQDPIIRDNFLKLIYLAKDSIKISTPYFIPDDTILSALKIASYSGVKVEIMIPSKSDHFLVLYATHFFIGQLLEAGVNIYEYTNGFLHSKVITVDDTVCSIGSANMDIRSFKLNFEINAIIYNAKISKEVSEKFDSDKKIAKEYTLKRHRERSLFKRFIEQLARLFSPIM